MPIAKAFRQTDRRRLYTNGEMFTSVVKSLTCFLAFAASVAGVAVDNELVPRAAGVCPGYTASNVKVGFEPQAQSLLQLHTNCHLENGQLHHSHLETRWKGVQCLRHGRRSPHTPCRVPDSYGTKPAPPVPRTAANHRRTTSPRQDLRHGRECLSSPRFCFAAPVKRSVSIHARQPGPSLQLCGQSILFLYYTSVHWRGVV